MTYPRATALTAAVKARIELITVANGYRTEIGRRVHVGVLRGTPTDTPCSYLLPAAELGAVQYGVAQRERTYTVTSMINGRDTAIDCYPPDPGAEWVIVDAVNADLCEAIEAAGAFDSSLVEHVTYEGSKPAYSEEGGELIGVKATYSIRYAIGKGDPDNPPS